MKKCSLSGLEKRSDLLFFTYPCDALPPEVSSYLLLKTGAPPLSPRDASRGLLLLDGTWRLAKTMEKQLPHTLEIRSLPSHFRTAYPRRQTDCPHPEEGLASLEALFLAYLLLGYSTEGLLDHYYWKNRFLELNFGR